MGGGGGGCSVEVEVVLCCRWGCDNILIQSQNLLTQHLYLWLRLTAQEFDKQIERI